MTTRIEREVAPATRQSQSRWHDEVPLVLLEIARMLGAVAITGAAIVLFIAAGGPA